MKYLDVVERVVSTAWQAALGAAAAGAETIATHATDWRTYGVFLSVTVLGALVKNLAVKLATNPVVKDLKPVAKAVAAVPAVKAVVDKVETAPLVAEAVKVAESIPVANPARTVVSTPSVLTFAAVNPRA